MGYSLYTQRYPVSTTYLPVSPSLSKNNTAKPAAHGAVGHMPTRTCTFRSGIPGLREELRALQEPKPAPPKPTHAVQALTYDTTPCPCPGLHTDEAHRCARYTYHATLSTSTLPPPNRILTTTPESSTLLTRPTARPPLDYKHTLATCNSASPCACTARSSEPPPARLHPPPTQLTVQRSGRWSLALAGSARLDCLRLTDLTAGYWFWGGTHHSAGVHVRAGTAAGRL
jgi:hypothetical protein